MLRRESFANGLDAADDCLSEDFLECVPSRGKSRSGPSLGKSRDGPSRGKSRDGPSLGKSSDGPSLGESKDGGFSPRLRLRDLAGN